MALKLPVKLLSVFMSLLKLKKLAAPPPLLMLNMLLILNGPRLLALISIIY